MNDYKQMNSRSDLNFDRSTYPADVKAQTFFWRSHHLEDPDFRLRRANLKYFSVCYISFFVGGGSSRSIAKLDMGRASSRLRALGDA